jgi:hypothetical protein
MTGEQASGALIQGSINWPSHDPAVSRLTEFQITRRPMAAMPIPDVAKRPLHGR